VNFEEKVKYNDIFFFKVILGDAPFSPFNQLFMHIYSPWHTPLGVCAYCVWVSDKERWQAFLSEIETFEYLRLIDVIGRQL